MGAPDSRPPSMVLMVICRMVEMWRALGAHVRPHLLVAIKNRELVASDERRCHTGSANGIDVVKTVAATILRGKNVKLI